MLSLYCSSANRRKCGVTLTTIVLLTTVCIAVASSASAQTRVSVQVDWATARQDLQQDRAAIRAENRQFRAGGALQSELDKARLPILIINQGPVRAAPEFRQQGVSYVAAYQLPRATLSILGSATALELPSDVKSDLARNAQDEYVFTGVMDEEEDDVANLSFSRYGVSYVLRLACERSKDQRCREPGFLRSIAAGLANVGGRP